MTAGTTLACRHPRHYFVGRSSSSQEWLKTAFLLLNNAESSGCSQRRSYNSLSSQYHATCIAIRVPSESARRLHHRACCHSNIRSAEKSSTMTIDNNIDRHSNILGSTITRRFFNQKNNAVDVVGQKKTKNDQDINIKNNDNKKSKKRQQHSKKKVATPFTNIQQAQNTMQELLDRLDALHIPSPTVQSIRQNNNNNNRHNLHSTINATNTNDNAYNHLQSEDSQEQLYNILQETKSFVKDLVPAVEQGYLNPSRKHGQALSTLMECVLYNYSRCCYGFSVVSSSSSSSTLSKECQKVLKVLNRDWNLDIQNNHYEYAITVALQESNYQIASDLFGRQIDPNAGRTPVIVDIDNPQGLYAIAMLYGTIDDTNFHDAANNTYDDQTLAVESEPTAVPSAAAEHVMDAVQRLIMISPQDQNTYILAAGNALGYAGRWHDFIEYWKTSFLSKQYGTPLVAAVMQACCLCNQFHEAWKVLEETNLLTLPGAAEFPDGSSYTSAAATATTGFGGEWQYGGERDRIDPLIRDLAMQAIKASPLPAKTTPQNEQNTTGGGKENDTLTVSQVALELFHQSRKDGVTISKEALTSVMHACERDCEWQAALSVLNVIFEEEAKARQNYKNDDNWRPWIVSGTRLEIEERDHPSPSSVSGTGYISYLPDLGDLLASAMRNCNSASNFGISLFYLRQFQQYLPATADVQVDSASKVTPDIYTSIENSIQNTIIQIHHSNDVVTASMVALCGLRCYEQAINIYNFQDEAAYNAAASMVYRYATSCQSRFGTLVLGNPWVTAHRYMHHLTATARFLKLKLAEKEMLDAQEVESMNHALAQTMKACTSAHQTGLSLHILEWSKDILSSVAKTGQVIPLIGTYGDSITAETISARRWSQDVGGAIELFETYIRQQIEGKVPHGRLTIASGLAALIAGGRGDDALRIFEALDENLLSTDCYTSIGQYLSREKRWKDLIHLYRQAITKGFSSEELSMMAMTAVISTKNDNRLRILRAIVDECAGNVGLDSQIWMTSRYWQIKRELGFHYARLLMWWNDPDRAPVDELNLAIKEFHWEVSNDLRPKNDVVRAIMNGARYLDLPYLEGLEGYERVPKNVEEWTALIGEVLEVTRESPIHCDPNFVDNVVHAFKSLRCSRECVEYISTVLNQDGTRMRRSTLAEALQAAKIEEAVELSNDISMLLSRKKTAN